MNQPLAIFSTSYSGKSILSLDVPKKNEDGSWKSAISPNDTVSLINIALLYDLGRTVIVERQKITNFWEVYENFKEIKKPYIYGVQLVICHDSADKSPESRFTESEVIVIFKNSQSYYKAVPFLTAANTTNLFKWDGEERGRLDWEELQELVGDGSNFSLWMPFYSSFIANNFMKFGYAVVPRWGSMSPIFLIGSHDLPTDDFLERQVTNYAEANGFRIHEAHWVYYYKDEDAQALQAFRCVLNRSTLGRPELPHFCSDSFSLESYLRKIGKELVESEQL